jgi:hypothetical protein
MQVDCVIGLDQTQMVYLIQGSGVYTLVADTSGSFSAPRLLYNFTFVDNTTRIVDGFAQSDYMMSQYGVILTAANIAYPFYYDYSTQAPLILNNSNLSLGSYTHY